MRVLALLPNAARRVLERALARGQVLSGKSSPEEIARAVNARGGDVLVLDPSMLGEEEYGRLLAQLAERRIPLLLFTALTPANARRIVTAAEVGVHELVLRRDEDGPALLASKLAALLASKLASLLHPSAPAHLLSRVAPRLRRFPDGLQAASVSLFGSGPLPRWVDELAASSGFARRSVDRWMERVGIDGASMLLDTARLARVWKPLVEEKLTLAAVTMQCGYARQRLFVAHAQRIVGVSPMALAATLSRREFSDRLARALLER